MANPNPSAISAAFPAPPPFYKSFTPQNLDRLHELLEASNPEDSDPPQSAGKSSQKETSNILSLPPELRCLIPPPPPPEGRYRSFGDVHDVSSCLLSAALEAPSIPKPSYQPPQLTNTQQLNPAPPSTTTPTPSPPHLLHLTRCILLTFLSLVNRLATTPATYAPKWNELRALFEEAHAVINEYRPHQARETLILMMEEQIQRCRSEGRAGREGAERVKKVLEEVGRVEGVGKELLRGEGGGRGERAGDGEGEKRLWEVINREVGRA
jgi:mediator of RNA polymerase II transcription subunit 7